MKKQFKLLVFSVITTIALTVGFISCRKTDLLPNDAATTLENKFFNTHRSADPIEKSIVEFIKRENDKKHFIEKTANQIGYPRWDKMIKKPSKSATNGNIATLTVGGNTAENTTDVYYVPFVRDSQNYVNASMIVEISPTDTSFSYLCDWQYKNKPHGSANSNIITAEKIATFFMALDYTTLGHNSFQIIDLSLFPHKTKEGKRVIGFKNLPTLQTTPLLAYHEICVDWYVCNSPDYCAEHGGCDYLNCIADPQSGMYCFVLESNCVGWWDNIGGGGSGGSDGGGSPGGGGAGSPGGGTPPRACDEVEPTSSSSQNGNVTTFRDPCDDTPGWMPVDPLAGKELAPADFVVNHYWEDPTYDNNDYINPPCTNPTDCAYNQDGYRKNGPLYNYTGGTVQNYTDDKGGKYAIFTKPSGEQIKFPDATITDFGVTTNRGATTSNGGIHADLTFDLPALQHEYGHYLQAKLYGSILYNTYIVPASLWDAAVSSPQDHNNFWTEKEANQLSIDFFGLTSAIGLNPARFPR